VGPDRGAAGPAARALIRLVGLADCGGPDAGRGICRGLAACDAAASKEMAMRELRDTDHLDFRCDDPEQIRRWVKAKAGIDIELPGRQASGCSEPG